MDILSLAMTGAGGLGVGVVLGAVVMRPQVGPWYGSRPACPCAHPAATATAVHALPTVMPLQPQVARQIPAHFDTTPDSLVTAYVTTGNGVVPVKIAAAALMPAAPGAGLVAASPGEITGGAQ
jgi:hypothetical protein